MSPDAVGGALFDTLVGALRQGGRYSSSGAIAGPVVDFDLRQMIYKDPQLTGATIVPPGTAPRLVRLIEQGLLRPLLAAQYPLHELAAAQEAFMEKRHVGSCRYHDLMLSVRAGGGRRSVSRRLLVDCAALLQFVRPGLRRLDGERGRSRHHADIGRQLLHRRRLPLRYVP